MHQHATLISHGGVSPSLAPSAWAAPGAVLVGDVRLAGSASVWYGAVLRADGDRIAIGSGSNIQDLAVLHADPGTAVVIGEHVSVGHRALLHSCRVGDGALIGMGSIVLDGAEIGAGSLVAAGAVVLGGTTAPAGSLVVGAPARVRRLLGAAEQQDLRANAATYVRLAAAHRASVVQASPPQRKEINNTH